MRGGGLAGRAMDEIEGGGLAGCAMDEMGDGVFAVLPRKFFGGL